MELLSLTLKGAQRTSHQVRPRQKVVPWLYLGLVWCSMFHCTLPEASRNKSTTKHSWTEWHIGGIGEMPPDSPSSPRWSWADTAATFLRGESQEPPTHLQAKSGARKEPHTACTQGVWKDAHVCIHGKDAQKEHMPGYREHKHTCAWTRRHIQRWQPQQPHSQSNSSFP